ncbi:MAG: TIGR03960 family B12-binding radical SAM protein [Ardenticatenaceae bacterium]|nr:TIGR03960 family B12-binding radical SAM protein [Ardenticatenaceae bacterium]MCB9446125.1 TIGR03960 family B12-binding radical SAM protein [Ardenticatenaceae bacterium]
MLSTHEQIELKLERILPRVTKPGRYTGGEYNQIVKNWDEIDFKVALAFPDIYDIGMSNLGMMILYDIINKHKNLLAERAYSPWTDMEAIMRQREIPLFSLETKHTIRDFDLLGISLPYEQLFTNTLNLLDLAGMPVRSLDRDASYPLVVAGGHACYNPEPMAPFIDVFVIGEGEEAILKIIGVMRAARHLDRETQLRYIAQIEGCYVPRFYDVTYHDDGTIKAITPNMAEAPPKVLKTIVPVMPPPVTDFIIPFIETVHNRAPIEIMRGCTRGCRFCHAGMVTRPVRERPVEEVLAAMDKILESTGYEEIALLSLSSSDYTNVIELTEKIGQRFGHLGLNISLPSLRIESVSTQLMDNLGDSKRGGFTLAPEAATEKMRSTINKYVTHEELLETAREIYKRDWRTIKLYFMIGHPMEEMEDVEAIIDLARQVLFVGREYHGKKASVNVGVSTFIPKPHTPFQWEPMGQMDELYAKLERLKDRIRGPGLRLRWNHPKESVFEGILSRGDRRIAEVVELAWRKGAKFDAWMEHYAENAWNEALAEMGLAPTFYTHRRRPIDEIFPWEHIDIAVTKKFLTQDYLMSQEQETRVDCRHNCFACGILPKLKDLRRETAVDAWECPPVPTRKHHQPRQERVPVVEGIPLTVIDRT